MLKWIFGFVLQGHYRVKHRKAGGDLPKLVEVVMSCTTIEQCEAGKQYLQLYHTKHLAGRPVDGYTRTSVAVMREFMHYLDDTREHLKFGMHYPKNAESPVAEFPNMNNYVGKVLNVRFKPFWKEGVTSILGPKE